MVFPHLGPLDLDDASLGASKLTKQWPAGQLYPSKLLYAQNMLTMSLTQLSQVELHITMLKFHIEMHALAASLSEQAALGASTVGEVTVQEQKEGVAEAQAAPAEQGPPAAPRREVPRDGGPPRPAQGAEPRPHRRHIAVAVKVTLVMLLLELRVGWFLLWFFMVFLYMGGVFDPLHDWLRAGNQVTLEQQLTALRNRQLAAAASAREAAQVAATAPETANSSSQERPVPSAEGSAATSPTAAAVAPEVPPRTEPEGAEGDGAAAGQPPGHPGPPPPPWLHRFFYQLVVMFFMTLIPWWHPNPRYL